jgi:predicted nucleic acid-binding protein
MDESEDVPCDAPTLIYLAKADAFDELLPHCAMRLVVTPGVWREAVEDGEAAGYADASVIREAEMAGHVTRVELSQSEAQRASTIASAHRLGQGESETLAIATPDGHVLVDDGRASRVALAMGYVPMSTLFLPLLAVQRRSLAGRRGKGVLRRIAQAANARAEAVIDLERRIDEEGAP